MSKPAALTLEVTSLLRRLICHKGDCLCGNVDLGDLRPEILRLVKTLEDGGRVTEHMDGAATVYPPPGPASSSKGLTN